RRHTRSYGDWSSDVCSSDLSSDLLIVAGSNLGDVPRDRSSRDSCTWSASRNKRVVATADMAMPDGPSGGSVVDAGALLSLLVVRSEERRVGKECGCGGWPDE